MTTSDSDNLPAVPESLADRVTYARTLAPSDLLPRQYRGRPENVLYAIEFGRTLGVGTIAAITQVHIIEGKPSAGAHLISALVRRAGHRLRVGVERDGNGNVVAARATINRCDDPEHTFESVWTMQRAQTAGLADKENYRKIPEAMLKARAVTEVAREACAEALCGIHYTPEELGFDGDGAPPATASRPVQPASTIRATVEQHAAESTAAPAAPADETERHDRPAVADPTGVVTGGQLRRIATGMHRIGIRTREDALAYVNNSVAADHHVESRNELDQEQADRLIALLEAEPMPEPVDAEIVDERAEGGDAA